MGNGNRGQPSRGAGSGHKLLSSRDDCVSCAQETPMRLPRSSALIRLALFWCSPLMSCI